jgi:hypothetical protein
MGKVVLGNVNLSLIASAGAIGSLTMSSLTGSRVMSAAALGADGKLGGTGPDADTFAPGSIGTVRVLGAIDTAEITAGRDPVDGVFNNGDDRVLGGAESVIRSVTARSATDDSLFMAGKIISLRLPGAVDLTNDPRVKVMA